VRDGAIVYASAEEPPRLVPRSHLWLSEPWGAVLKPLVWLSTGDPSNMTVLVPPAPVLRADRRAWRVTLEHPDRTPPRPFHLVVDDALPLVLELRAVEHPETAPDISAVVQEGVLEGRPRWITLLLHAEQVALTEREQYLAGDGPAPRSDGLAGVRSAL
jgi:hypothetical protein